LIRKITSLVEKTLDLSAVDGVSYHYENDAWATVEVCSCEVDWQVHVNIVKANDVHYKSLTVTPLQLDLDHCDPFSEVSEAEELNSALMNLYERTLNWAANHERKKKDASICTHCGCSNIR